jgi:hypothetical protein
LLLIIFTSISLTVLLFSLIVLEADDDNPTDCTIVLTCLRDDDNNHLLLYTFVDEGSSLSLSHEDGHLDNPSSTQINSGAAECQPDRHLDQEVY